MKYRGVFISDIHIGDMELEKLKYEIENAFYPFLATHDLDFVIFGGDYFGHKLYMNDPNASFCTELLNEVHRLLKPEAKIRMVYGTRSHDEDQYEIFSYLKDDRDFRLIPHVSTEELFEDMQVLYLPEEMIEDQDNYYKEYFEDDKYDLVCGHGIIQEIMKLAAVAIANKANVKRKVPIFKVDDLERICTGLTLFGHYHIHNEIRDRICYPGSFSRWVFGEEEDKGFYYLEYDPDEERGYRWKKEFIKNEFAEKYTTIGFGYKDTVFKSIDEMKQRMDHFENLTKGGSLDHLRLEFNIPEDCDNSEYYMEYLKERFKRNPNIKVNVINGYIDKKKRDAKKAVDEDYEKYAPLFDPNTSIEDQVSYFINVEYNKDIPPKTVSTYLYSSLNEIIESENEGVGD